MNGFFLSPNRKRRIFPQTPQKKRQRSKCADTSTPQRRRFRTLSVLSAGVHRSCPSRRQRLSHLDVLLRLITQQRQYCETLSFLAFYEEDSIGTIANDHATPIFCTMSKHLMVRRMGPIMALSIQSPLIHAPPPAPPVLFSVSRPK